MKKQANRTETVSFTISRLPPSLNTMLRTHWSELHRLQETFDMHVFVAWQASGRKIFTEPVKLLYVLSFPEKRPRDVDNYIGGTKLITDALKKTFLFRDDSEWITQISIRFIQGKEGTAIFIEKSLKDEEEWPREISD